MAGYWNKPEASASSIGDDGWLRPATADILPPTATSTSPTG
ncbi:MAG: hypothetical protein M3Z25_20710 [Actinomycetota bacterium]|nr:hypothetical protein [Actinomycetota bacterium]